MSKNDRVINSINSFDCIRSLSVEGKIYHYFDLLAAESNGLAGLGKLPVSLKVLIENMLRHENGTSITKETIIACVEHGGTASSDRDISFSPARVLMQDFTGVPAVVDLAAMRDVVQKKGNNPADIDPLIPVDLVIDHSIMVDHFASRQALSRNVDIDYERNRERYDFLCWGAQAFDNLTVVPPGVGICHQVNLEYFAKLVWSQRVILNGQQCTLAYPDTLIGTDSHTTMVNAMAVLGWGVGGIEAEAAMLGQALSMLVPQIIGFRLKGKLNEGVTATDLVLNVTEKLRQKNVVGKFVEFCGDGLDYLSLEDRATISNMAPEYGATCGFFPADDITFDYMSDTARPQHLIELAKTYNKANGLNRSEAESSFADTIEINLADVRPSVAGPRRPQDRIELHNVTKQFHKTLVEDFQITTPTKSVAVKDENFSLQHGSIVIAAITSCTNTSNPGVMLAAGLIARNANRAGLKVKPWVKTSLAPGSRVVSKYLENSGLQKELDKMGFNLVGYGCTTCIGNSGPLPTNIAKAINDNKLVAASVLSGNRNFEGRIHPHVKANFLASPPLVIAYAIAGRIDIDFDLTPLGQDKNDNPVYMRDIWPGNADISRIRKQTLSSQLFSETYANCINGDARWQAIKPGESLTYRWDKESTYIRKPPFVELVSAADADIENAHILAVFADSITTDHISPAGAILYDSPAGDYLTEKKVLQKDFNSYGARRGNHEVMLRGTFGNIRIKNRMLADNKEGGFTYCYANGGGVTSIYEAARYYAKQNTPLVVFAGKEYGTGSSRDWAAKGTQLLGVKTVIAESFERIHRTNLVGMGVLPLVFADNFSWQKAEIDGSETVSIKGIEKIEPLQKLDIQITRNQGSKKGEVFYIPVVCRIDTSEELRYYKAGGILPYVMENLFG